MLILGSEEVKKLALKSERERIDRLRTEKKEKKDDLPKQKA